MATSEPDSSPAATQHALRASQDASDDAALIETLIEALGARIRDVNGVTDLLEAAPPAESAIGSAVHVAQAIVLDRFAPIVATRNDDGLDVLATIEIDASAQAPAVVRTVIDAIHDTARAIAGGTINVAASVRVARIRDV